MKSVKFEWSCAQAVVQLRVEDESGTLLRSLQLTGAGSQVLKLPAGAYRAGYRAQGTPGTVVTVSVASGATMNAIERTVPASGSLAGVRKLTVS